MNKKGFTLVELIIAMVVGLLIMFAIYGSMEMAMRTSANVGRRVTTQQDVRAVLGLMALEIREASFNPGNNTANIPPTNLMWANACGVATTMAFKGIQAADTSNIVVLADVNRNGVIGVSDPNEFISYSYNAGSQTISRGVGCPPNTISNVILGGATVASTTRVVNGAAGVRLFEYFDRNGVDITDVVVATPAMNVPLIRLVRINIVAQTQNANILRYSTDVLVRNHAIGP